MADETSLVGGRLLGTAKVQEGVDDVGKALKEFAGQIRQLASLTKATYAPGSAAAGAVPMGFGKPLGGGAVFNGMSSLAASQQRGATMLGGGVPGGGGMAGPPTQSAPGTPNGGGASFGSGPGTWRSAAFGGAAAAWRSAVSFGNRSMTDQATMEYASRYYGTTSGLGFSGVNNALFQNRFYGQSTGDVAQAVSNLAGTSGMRVGSASFTQMYSQFGGLAAMNPLQSAASQAQGYASMTSSRGYLSLAPLGIQTLGSGGRVMGQNQIYSQISGAMGINWNRRWNSRSIAANFDNQNSAINYNLRYMVQNGMLSQDSADSYLQAARNRAIASSNGVSLSQYDQMTKAYGAGDKSAGDWLKNVAGISNLDTIVSSEQRKAGTQRNRLVDQTESFAAGVKRANEIIGTFSQAITNFLHATGLNKAIGYGAGGSAALSGAMGGTIGALGGMLGPMAAKSALGGVLRGAGGQVLTKVPGLGAGAGAGISGTAVATVGLGAAAAASVGAAAGRTRGTFEERGMDSLFDKLYGNGFDSYSPAQQKYLMSQYSRVQDAIIADNHTNNTDSVLHSMFYGNSYSEQSAVLNAIQQNMPGASGGAAGGVGRSHGGQQASNSGKPLVNGGEIVKFAMQFNNRVPYKFGGTTPSGWDCSGFVLYVFSHFGVKMPRLAGDQSRGGKPVSRGQLAPGDLVFFEEGGPSQGLWEGVDHVGIYIGGGKMINAPHTGAMTRVESVWWDTFAGARRYVGAGSGGFSGINGANTALGSADAGNTGSVLGGSSEAAVVQAALGGAAGAGAYGGTSGGFGGANGRTVSAAGGSPSQNEKLGRQMAASMYGWTGSQANALDQLWTGESGWRTGATNSSSGAYGIPQSLPGNKMASAGADWKTNPATQIKWGLQYIKDRYGSPSKAYAMWLSRNPHWYDSGAWEVQGDEVAQLHKGEMVLNPRQADTIRQALLNHTMGAAAPRGGGGGVTLVFTRDSIKIMGGGSEEDGRRFGQAVVRAITEDHRIRDLQVGV